MLNAIIFVTGAAILALELLASRILTPYFGVSLYIWSGILSITLISLASGYWAGGKIAHGSKGARQSTTLTLLFALMPAIAAIAIVASCLAYPYLFYALARMDLVFGAFIACLVLLFVPLLATSAMNPLLVAILLRQKDEGGGLADAGAGRVFFISTLGSVAGVFVTAFGIIPFLSNFAATLVVAVTLATLSLILLMLKSTRLEKRKSLAVTTGIALVSSIAALAGADYYTGRMWPVSHGDTGWSHEASYRSMFGTVKVLRSNPMNNRKFLRIYFQDGLIQNVVDSDNHSTSMYTYALEALSLAYRPEPQSALVLGIGAGMVPMRLANYGIAVTAVDIDPASLRAASEVFGLERDKVRVHEADARTFLQSCASAYHVIVVDLFHGDGVPDYLITREFFRDLGRCLAPDGVAIFNTFADLDAPRTYAHFLTTLRSELPYVMVHRPDHASARHINSFVVASARPLPAPATVDLRHVPAQHLDTLSQLLRTPIPLNQRLLDQGRVATDARNILSRDMSASQLVYRRHVVDALPAAFFVN